MRIRQHRASDVSGVHHDWFGERPLLVRAGGYWWDGKTWYRPRQVIDWASEGYMRRPARLPTTITPTDLLDDTCKPELGHLVTVTLNPTATVTREQWGHDLALWEQHRRQRPDAPPADRCVVTLNAPELSDAALLGVEEFARQAGIGTSTLRAYISRGEADIPLPQVSDGNRKRWAKPVVADWLEQRRRDPRHVQAALNDDEDLHAPGLKRLAKRMSEAVFGALWGPPPLQRRWSRPHRNEQSARALAEQIGWIAARHLDTEMLFDDMLQVLQGAILWDLQHYAQPSDNLIVLSRQTCNLLEWFLDHNPHRAHSLFGAIVRQAKDQLGSPPAKIKKCLRGALSKTDEHRRLLDVALPPDE